MRDNPHGAALLAVARQSLLDEVAPVLSGRARYVALMVANAMGIVSREIEQSERVAHAWNKALAASYQKAGEPLDAALGRLGTAIRDGRHDGDATLYGALLETAEVAAGIWKPTKPEA